MEIIEEVVNWGWSECNWLQFIPISPTVLPWLKSVKSETFVSFQNICYSHFHIKSFALPSFDQLSELFLRAALPLESNMRLLTGDFYSIIFNYRWESWWSEVIIILIFIIIISISQVFMLQWSFNSIIDSLISSGNVSMAESSLPSFWHMFPLGERTTQRDG